MFDVGPQSGAEERTGVLVLRVWVEPDTPQLLRARLTQVSDLQRGERTVATAIGTPAICEAVERWLYEFQRSGPGLTPR